MALPYHIIILAAGESSRLGQAKQLLKYNGDTLLNHTIACAKLCNPKSVLVVLGAESDIIQKSILSTACHVIYNDAWSSGMSSSIRAGVSWIIRHHDDFAGIIITVADQPYLTGNLFSHLIAKHQNQQQSIVASAYGNGVCGVPALFDKRIISKLSELQGDKGARALIHNSDDVGTVSFPKGNIDIDTKEDLAHLID